MKDNTPLDVTFAALQTLIHVYNLRSFTDTAVKLDVNQSAVSYTIEKLRKAFSDPLFYRQGGRVVPTERCHTVVKEATEILERFHQVVSPEDFDPQEATGTFTIACNFYERHIVLPDVVHAIRRSAPNILVKLLTATHRGPGLLKQGEADLLIGPLKPDENDFYCRTLLNEHYVCVMDPANPLGEGPLTLDAYAACNHATVTYGGEWQSSYLVELERLGVTLNDRLTLPSPASLDRMIQGTDLVSTIPQRLTEPFAGTLKAVESPLPSAFDIHMVWTTRTHNSAMYRWLRDLIFDTVRETRS